MDVSSRAVRDEKVKVLQSLRAIPRVCAVNGVVRAQYAAGTCRGKAGPGLPPGARRRAGFADGDVRRVQGERGQLALGGRAVLPSHRQAPAAAADADLHPLQAGAANPVQRRPGRATAAERARAAHPAGRGNLPPVPAEGPGDDDGHPAVRDEVRLRRGLRQAAAGGVRAAAARRGLRRLDALHPQRRVGSGLGVRRADHRGLQRRARRTTADLPGRNLGPEGGRGSDPGGRARMGGGRRGAFAAVRPASRKARTT